MIRIANTQCINEYTKVQAYKVDVFYVCILVNTAADQMFAGSIHPYCPPLLANHWPSASTVALHKVDW